MSLPLVSLIRQPALVRLFRRQYQWGREICTMFLIFYLLLIVLIEHRSSDWIIGVNFLRNVYSIYDFGDFTSNGQTGNPYMKFLSVIDPDEASADFHAARGGQAETNITYQAVQGTAAIPSFNVSQDTSATLDMIGKYLPAMLGLLALNALILIVITITGTIIYCRRRGPVASTRNPRGRMSPMPMNPRNTYIPGSFNPPEQAHTYEPVSMALTEDTFVPPSPAFHSFEGNRPKSMA